MANEIRNWAAGDEDYDIKRNKRSRASGFGCGLETDNYNDVTRKMPPSVSEGTL